MAQRHAIIAVQDPDTGIVHKVVRLLMLGDGSFAISSPYHPATTGVLSKIRLPETVVAPGPRWVAAEIEFRVSSVVKLMYHAGGFVQFSSGGKGQIKSGSLPPEEFLIPKGLGIHTQPITDPIDTGPTVGADFRGINMCKRLADNEKTPVILFHEQDMLIRMDTFEGVPMFSVDFWVFPSNERPNAILRGGRWTLEREMANVPVPVELRVIDLPTRFAFLGVQVRFFHPDSDRSTEDREHEDREGWYALHGPRALVGGHHLMGIFPADAHDGALPTLDYAPPDATPPG